MSLPATQPDRREIYSQSGNHEDRSITQPSTLTYMQRTSFEDMNCSVAQCLEVVGDWWSLLIVRDAFLGVRRFDDFQARLGISRNIFDQRLTKLVDDDVLDRVPYQDNPPSPNYRLTENR